MSHIHHIRRLVGMLTGLAAALVAAVAVAPAAFATVEPPPGPLSRFEPVAPPLHRTLLPAHTHSAVTGGMAGWQIALIAAGAAIVAAVVAVLLDRAWAARRHPAPTHA